MKIIPLTPEYFTQVIALGNLVHGDNYLDKNSLTEIYHKGIKNGVNAHFIALDNKELLGFRLTYAPGNWKIDNWCSYEKWPVNKTQVCYFKCNTVAEAARGKGIGSQLLQASVAASKKQGALAGISHIWLQSPGNSAFKYFSKAGGILIKKHPDRWLQDSIEHGYVCTLCGDRCHCEAAEMLLSFN